MSHKAAKLARKLLKRVPEAVKHEPMTQHINVRQKSMKLPGIGTVNYETFTVVHAKDTYREVYKDLKKLNVPQLRRLLARFK